MSAGKILKYFLSLIFLTITFSCSFINFEKVSFTFSVAENSQIFEGEFFIINSSYDLQKSSFENIISLQENKTTVVLDYEWIDNSTLLIKPHSGWKKGLYYHFELNGNVDTVTKGSFSLTEHRHFLYGKIDENFILTDYTKTELNEKDSLLFTFSKPVDQKSFITNFSISPSIETNITFDNENTVALVSAKEKWAINRQYTWTISQSLSSQDGYYLKDKYSDLINTISDTENPKILTVCPVSLDGTIFFTEKNLSELKDNQPIGFIFSKEMNFSSIENNITFSPAIKGDFYKVKDDNTRFIFKPYSNYEIKKEYTLKIQNKCKDLVDNELFEDKQIKFTAVNDFLKVLSIKINGILLSTENPVEVTVPYGEMTVEIAFSREIKDKILAENSISAGLTFPSTCNAPTKEAINWSNTLSQVTLKYSNLSSSTTDDYYYKVNVTGTSSGIKDSTGNYMENDVCVYFITR
ncbi:MAG: Ig-like domain-containing protein [Treponema sp.]|nr:Ig-like domain-containing protein [Candidatus Treponema merdequi]